MKAISLWQPWASAIQLGHKRIETRGWSTSYRGPIAIHAALTKVGLWNELRVRRGFWCDVLGIEMVAPIFRAMPRGAVVAVAELVDVVPVDSADDTFRLSKTEWELGDYSPGRFAWLLQNVRELPHPIPCRGRQLLFEVDVPTEFVA